MFKSLMLDQQDKKTIAEIREIDVAMLPNEDVLIDVSYSSLNYKDGLAITGKGRIVRNFNACWHAVLSANSKKSLIFWLIFLSFWAGN